MPQPILSPTDPLVAPETAAARNPTARRLQLAFFILGSVSLAIIIIRSDPRRLLAEVRASGWTVPAIVGVYGAVYVLNAIAWRMTMMEPPRISFPRTYMITVSAFAMNYLTPFVSIGGEPFKIVAASQWLGPSRGTASVLNFRLLHIQAHVLVFLSGVVLAFFLVPRDEVGTGALLAIATLLLVLGGVVFSIHRRGMLESLLDLLVKIPVVRRLGRKLEARREALIDIDDQLMAFHRDAPLRYYGALAAEYAARVLSMLEFFFIARGVGTPVSFPVAFLIGSFSSLIVNFFFFIPFNAGTKEGGLYFIFHLLGLPARLGVAAAVISRLRELSWIIIGLLLILATRKRSHPQPAD
jgi:lysylphosphatidylglycerol synthase-like protein